MPNDKVQFLQIRRWPVIQQGITTAGILSVLQFACHFLRDFGLLLEC